MYMPGQTHVLNEMTPKTRAEQRVLHPPAESVQAKDTGLRGREKHWRPTRSKQDPAAGHQPGTDKSGYSWVLFHVKYIKGAEQQQSTADFPFSDTYANCQAQFLWMHFDALLYQSLSK